MSRIAYVNGRYLDFADAGIHIEDRAVQFADGVYEVCPVRASQILDLDLHLDRLQYSLGELAIDMKMTRGVLGHILAEVVRRNNIKNGYVYFQISRGIAPRNHVFPNPPVPPSLIVTARPAKPAGKIKGIKIITQPDIRWARVDIKSLSLLPNILAREAASQARAAEAWLVDKDGLITEGAASNAWIIDHDDRILTRHEGQAILRGITRRVLLDIAEARGLKLEQQAFSVDQAKSAREAFVTSASFAVMPVVQIDDVKISSGKPGPVSLELRAALEDFVTKQIS